MSRQILTGSILLAFVNFLMGCTSVEQVPAHEAQGDVEKINELVLIEGDIIEFGEVGAKVRPARVGILGTTADDKPIFVPLEGLRECRISPPKSVSTTELGNAGIAEVLLRNRILLTFQEPGARYDSAADVITGTTTGGEPVTIPLGRVTSIRTERPDAVSADELKQRPLQTVYEVVELQNIAYPFGPKGGHLGSEPLMFYGTDRWGNYVEIPADSVLYARVTKTNVAGTILATLGVIAAVGLVVYLIILATKQSCPFIYSFNGEQYVFDAEPLGGAICPGLARTDISRLDHLKAVDGEYRLLIRNEVPETQYVDRMKLLVVDHPAGVTVYPDLQQRFYAFKNIRGVTSARDENGRNLMKFLRASDNIAWETHLPSASKEIDAPVRHQLTVTLPKPVGATKAWLVTNVGTSAWGSNVLRKAAEYRGNGAQVWLSSITPGSQSYTDLFKFIEDEEMYRLKAWVGEGASWKQESVIYGQGPFISEDRVYPIDVSNAVGDSLVLRFNPPKGFWTFDYLGVSYEDPMEIGATTIDAYRANDQKGTSILESLESINRGYYVMPEVGDWAGVRFPVPAQPEGTLRSVYLETNGYYEFHLPKDLPDQMARLYHVWTTPGQIVKTSLEEFRAWQADQQASLSDSH